MEEDDDRIIVYDSYETVVAANLAKTKLDAYDIPCFLTDENFVGLYPLKNELFPGVRLYIFEKDLDKVKSILTEQSIIESEVSVCPYCRSKRIEHKASKKSTWLTITTSILLGLFIHPKEVYYCMDCNREFNIPEEIKSSKP